MRKALDYLATFKPEDIDGSEKKQITLKRSGQDYVVTGEEYLLGRAQQNFWFHVTTAYNILRAMACRWARPTSPDRASGIALLEPGIAVVVIAADFPEAGMVAGRELDLADPFGALPEVEVRHHKPHRPAVVERQRLGPPSCAPSSASGEAKSASARLVV